MDPGRAAVSAEADDAEGERARSEARERLGQALGHRFNDPVHLDLALCHSSFAHEQGEGPGASNERLEFLGDTVLGLCVADALYRAHPDWREGELSRALHAMVEGRSLAEVARKLGVGPALALGRTERRSDGANKPSILENAFEAIVGAIYLDGGLASASAFIERVFAEDLRVERAPVQRDPKTALQERLMADAGAFPTYRMSKDSEIDGDDSRFTFEVVFAGDCLGQGTGRTKRAAEREAATRALESWRRRGPSAGSSAGDPESATQNEAQADG